MGKVCELIGDVFGRLTVISKGENTTGKQARYWLCQCSCGNQITRSSAQLLGNVVKSCGCYASELASVRMKITATTHGLSRSKAYRAWTDAKSRCYDTTHREYCRYGAIGIKMSEDLVNDVVLWCSVLGNPPDSSKSRKWSVDRIDCTKDYSVDNIRWADAGTQARNQKKQVTNTSGFTGVTWALNTHGGTRACCWWRDSTGKSCGKGFSVKKHGLLEAFYLACEYRNKKISELKESGIIYSDNHGK